MGKKKPLFKEWMVFFRGVAKREGKACFISKIDEEYKEYWEDGDTPLHAFNSEMKYFDEEFVGERSS